MYLSIPEWLKIVLGTLVIVGFALTRAARRYPDVEWLRAFRFAEHLTPEQRERTRRRANMHAAIQFILLGFIIPIAYLGLTLMTWSDFSPGMTMGVAACSVGCVTLGAWIAWRSRGR